MKKSIPINLTLKEDIYAFFFKFEGLRGDFSEIQIAFIYSDFSGLKKKYL